MDVQVVESPYGTLLRPIAPLPTGLDTAAKLRAHIEAHPGLLEFHNVAERVATYPELHAWAVKKHPLFFRELDAASRRAIAADVLDAVPEIVDGPGTTDLPFDDHLTGAVRKLARYGVVANGDPRLTELEVALRPSALTLLSPAERAKLPSPAMAPLLERARALGMTRVDDMDPLILERFVAAREQKRPDDRPLAVVIMATHDDEGFFDPMAAADLTRGYRVMYYEASTLNEAESAIEDATSEQRAKLVMFMAHGEPRFLRLGEHAPKGDVPGITIRDKDALVERGFATHLTPNARIILHSCATGEGGAGALNLANMFAAAAPEAQVDAPTGDVRGIMLELADDGAVSAVNFNVPTYHHAPAH